ncbi:uncharacterized protein [Dermacentor albipictus]
MSPNVATTSTAPITTTTMATSTPTSPLFKKKPIVVCHLVSPSHFSYGPNRTAVMNQEVPSPTLCDYFLLDLPFLPNGTFDRESYAFLSGGHPGHKFLFHIQITWLNFGDFLNLINSVDFLRSTRLISTVLKPNQLHGFGTLNGLEILEYSAGGPVTTAYIEKIYRRFSEILRVTGTDATDIKNFFAFKPNSNVIQYTYVQHLTTLNSVPDIMLVIILTITDEVLLEVYPSSAWNETCLPQRDQPNMTCGPHLFERDSTGASIHYIGGDRCAFAVSRDTTDAAISFETPLTIRHKMVETYRLIGYDLTDTFVVGWMVYNVTYGLAPENCSGRYNRIKAIRKVIDDNK